MDAWKEEQSGGIGVLRVGIVKHVYPEECAVAVSLPDVDDGDFVTFNLPVLQHCAGGKARGWWMPAIDDQVLCAFLPHAQDYGFVLGGFYAPDDTKPTSEAEDVALSFENGDYLHYKAQERTFECLVGQTHVKVSDGLVEAGNGQEQFVALAPDVKTQLDDIKKALDSLQDAFNNHTHNHTCAYSGAPIASLAPISKANHGYSVGEVAAKHVKAD